MAFTVLFALAGSLVLSLTFMPAMASLFLPKKMDEKEVLLVRMVKLHYLRNYSKRLVMMVRSINLELAVFIRANPLKL